MIVTMRTVLILTLFFYSFNSFSQNGFDSTKVSINLMKVVREIVQCRCIGNYRGGFGGEDDSSLSINNRFKKGTVQEFLELVNHPSKEVIYMAFNEVAERCDTFNFMPYIINSFKKNERINISSGSIVNEINLSDQLINLFVNRMTVEQRKLMDSILIFETIDVFYSDIKKENSPGLNISLSGPIKYREKLIYKLNPEEKYYQKLKSIYNKESSPLVVYAILKFAKPEDSIILLKEIVSHQKEYLFWKSQAFWCYRAIYEHPNNYYFSSLTKAYYDIKANYIWQDGYERYMYILALTKYRSTESIEIFLKMLKDDENLPIMKNSCLLSMALQEIKNDYFKTISDRLVNSPEDEVWMKTFKNGFDAFNKQLTTESQ